MDLKTVYQQRRAVNFFDTQKPLDQNVLEQIIDLAVLAPSAFNLQPWRVIAVKSLEAKQKLAKLASNQPKILEAPVTLIITGDRAGYSLSNPMWEEMEKGGQSKERLEKARAGCENLYGSTQERKIKFAESNTGLFAMSLMYAAKHYGVDSHPMSGIDFEGIKREFEIGNELEVVMLIALGYFDTQKTLMPRGKRLSYSEIVKEV